MEDCDHACAFAGGQVVCHGEGCHVHFSNVTFENISVVVLSGAQVTMHGCTFSQSAPCVSLYCHGQGTHVYISDSSIIAGLYGVAVQSDAVLEAQQIFVSQPAAGVLEQIDEDSEVHSPGDVMACSPYTSQGPAARECLYGVWVEDAVAQLTECIVSDCTEAAASFCGASTSCSVSDCSFLRNKIGVVAAEQATVNLTGCHGVQNHHGYVARSQSHLISNDCSSEQDTVGCTALGPAL